MPLLLGSEIPNTASPAEGGARPATVRGMPRLRPSPAELRGALAGAVAIGLAYAAGRRYGLTRSEHRARAGAGQPRRRPRGPARARNARLAAGRSRRHAGAARSPPARRSARSASREGRAFSAGAHALAAVVAQRVAARPRRGARRRRARRASVSSRPSTCTLSNRPGRDARAGDRHAHQPEDDARLERRARRRRRAAPPRRASPVQSQAGERGLHGGQDLGRALVPGDLVPRLLVDLDRAEEERAERLELRQRRDLLLRERRDLDDALGLGASGEPRSAR